MNFINLLYSISFLKEKRFASVSCKPNNYFFKNYIYFIFNAYIPFDCKVHWYFKNLIRILHLAKYKQTMSFLECKGIEPLPQKS